MSVAKTSLQSPELSVPQIQARRRLSPMKPTEVKPTEFFGVLLSWVYEAVLDEKSFAKDFLGSFEALNSATETPYDDDAEGTLTNLWDFLDFVTREGILYRLRLSLEPYTPFSESQHAMRDFYGVRPESLFEIMYTLDFYIQTTSKILCADDIISDRPLPQLVTYLVQLRESFYNAFKMLLDSQALQLHDHISQEAVSPTMRIPPFVIQAVKFLKELLLIFDQQLLCMEKAKLGAEEYESDERVMEFNDILNSIYNPIINVVRSVAARIPEEKALVYTLNCFSFMLAGLTVVADAKQYFAIYSVLESLTEENLKQIVECQTRLVLEKVGIKRGDKDPRLSEMDLVPIVQKLYTFAASSSASRMQLMSRISSSSLKARATRETLENLAAAYGELAVEPTDGAMVPDPSNIRELLLGSL
eukprot:Gregarina_sp_Pseudo_9__5614@NODE_771_length_2235_cov_5_181694_g726_i0_p1_GENE_NODE_771_length_2235_cov_5_181694_g726_i0NODE_771_length_2235_cov_5_181694_g726_i0_p1_ORF_typecomplete_len417_score72_84COG6/PF06419_11/8_4e36Vps52/PF04129_12/0_024_NODE_771_length_2235_cov_5_181694_g726_i011251